MIQTEVDDYSTQTDLNRNQLMSTWPVELIDRKIDSEIRFSEKKPGTMGGIMAVGGQACVRVCGPLV